MPGIYWSSAGRRRPEERYQQILQRWPVPAAQFRFPTVKGETFVLACGPPSAPPLMLFHGGLSNASTWMSQVPAWASHFRIYCVDTIGDPGFSAASRPSFATDEHALWLDDVWVALKLTQASVVGWSLGGWLGLDYAARRPNRVSSLVCLAPAGIVRMRADTIIKLLGLMVLGPWGRRKAFFTSMGFSNPVPEDLNAFVDFSLQSEVRPRSKLPGLFTAQMLSALRMPVMVVLGEQDVFFDAAKSRRRLEAHVPSSEIHSMTGVGHGLFGYREIILKFLLNHHNMELKPLTTVA